MCSLQAAGHLATGKGIRATVPPTENWASFFGETGGGRAARVTSAQAALALT